MVFNSMQLAYLGKVYWDQNIYAIRFERGCLSHLPFDGAEFECIILACDDKIIQMVAENIALEVSSARTDWVYTTGTFAEWLHDLIDETRVRIGRQDKVGDGSPMTAWFNEALTVTQKVKIVFSAFSGCSDIVALIVGDQPCFDTMVSAIRNELLRIQEESQYGDTGQ
jgi:hypothetical protein